MGKGNRIFRSLLIVLIGICVFMPIIYSLHFYFNRMLHRMEMWEKAESNLLQTIELDSATIQWTKKNRELIVEGEYFDIVSVSYQNGRATINGIFDDEETEMHEAFSRNQQTENAPGSSTQKIAEWLLQLWIFNNNPFSDFVSFAVLKEYIWPKPDCIIYKALQPPAPPPWHSRTIFF